MNTVSEMSSTESHPNIATGILKRFGAIAIFFISIALLLFLAAGRLSWGWAWVYLGISLFMVIVNGAILLRTNPETVAERGEARITKKWDKVVSGLYTLAMYFALPFVAGLDVRWGWTRDLNLMWHVAGTMIFVVGLELTSWAMIANAYFSTAVRIQSDRGHTVCRSGPYRFVRHPGYVGVLLQAIGVPILLGSWWALIPGLMAAAFIVIRTTLEDRTLQAELPGYQDYVQKVRYRFMPGVW